MSIDPAKPAPWQVAAVEIYFASERGRLATGPHAERSPFLVACRSLACWALHDYEHGPMLSYPAIAAYLLRVPGSHASAKTARDRLANPNVDSADMQQVRADLERVFRGERVNALYPKTIIRAYAAARVVA